MTLLNVPVKFPSQTFAAAGGKHLQSTLVRSRNQQIAKSVLESAPSLREKARIHAIRAPKASLWLSSLRSRREHLLTDDDFRIGLRLRFGLPPVDHMPDACGQCHADLQSDPWHYLCCPGRLITARHNSCTCAICAWVTRLGGYAKYEPKGLGHDEEKKALRPDGRWEFGASCILGDITIHHALAQSHIAKSSKGPLLSIQDVISEKKKKYADIARDEKAKFHVFALETTGGFSTQANAAVDALVEASKAVHYVWAPKEVTFGLKRVLAVAVQRGNAEIVLAGLRRDSR